MSDESQHSDRRPRIAGRNIGLNEYTPSRSAGKGNTTRTRYGSVAPPKRPPKVSGAARPAKPTKPSGPVPDVFGGALTPKGNGDDTAFACKPGDEGLTCLLTADERQEYARRIGIQLTIMLHQFGQAVDNIERSKLLKVKGKGWKMIFGIVFTVASRGLGAPALKILQRIKPLARYGDSYALKEAATRYAVRKDVVSMTLSGLGRSARTAASNAMLRYTKPSEFLTHVQNKTAAWVSEASAELRTLNDIQLLGLYAYLRAAKLDISYYEGQIKNLIARYEQQVNAVGKQGKHRTTQQAVWLTYKGKRRLALCENDITPLQKFQAEEARIRKTDPDRAYDYDKPFTNRYPSGPGLKNDGGYWETNHWSKSHVHDRRVRNEKRRKLFAAQAELMTTWFVRWIDNDMEELAIAKTQGATGGAKVIEINLDKGLKGVNLRDMLTEGSSGPRVRGMPKDTK
jgi:hypothetical protein